MGTLTYVTMYGDTYLCDHVWDIYFCDHVWGSYFRDLVWGQLLM